MKRRSEVDDEPPSKVSGAQESDSQSAASTEDSADEITDDELIKGVNALPLEDFKDRYVSPDLLKYTFKAESNGRKVTLDFKSSSDLSNEELSSCFNLIETTSRADYEPSSFGWHPKRKRREILEEEMSKLRGGLSQLYDDPRFNA